MTTEEGSFLRRWSRRKEEARHAEEEAEAREAAAEPAPPEAPEAEEAEEAPFDPGSLPPLESLGPESDYTAFLRRGVPRALRSAALRRAWASQPAIAGHRPLVEYDWNWNAPGYGALRPGDEAEPLIEALFGHLREKALPAPEPAAASGPSAPGVEPGAEPEADAPEATSETPPPRDAPPDPEAPRPEASQPEAPEPEADALAAEEGPPAAPRRHGGAVPV